MYQTYAKEKELKKKSDTIGKIGDRFQCSMTDLSLNKKYDFIYGHWSLGYLQEQDLY